MRSIKDYRPLLRSLVRQVCRQQQQADPDELEAEGLILIWEILKGWDEARGEPAGYLRTSLLRRLSAFLTELADGRLPAVGEEIPAREESIPPEERTPDPLEVMYLRCLRLHGRRYASRVLKVQVRQARKPNSKEGRT